jgi:hypothetical protein
LCWLLPPLLCLVAVGLHYLLDVPKAPMEARGKKKKKKKITRADAKFRPRDDDELAHLVEQWKDKPLDDEPELEKFADAHRKLLNWAVVRARERALEGTPDPIELQHELECRTVRCRVWLCGWPHEVALTEAELAGLRIDDEPAFLHYEVEGGLPPTIIVGDTPERSGSDAGIEEGVDTCLVVDLVLRRDLTKRKDVDFE